VRHEQIQFNIQRSTLNAQRQMQVVVRCTLTLGAERFSPTRYAAFFSPDNAPRIFFIHAEKR
jgi:hypothetical protein